MDGAVGNGSDNGGREICWERGEDIVTPDISASGFHPWPLDPTFPMHLRFVALGMRPEIPLLRHDYFEICFLHRGAVVKQVQDNFVPMNQGDLFVVGDKLFHRIAEYTEPVEEVLFYFLPGLILSDDSNWEDVEYLLPFSSQGPTFPHVIPADSGIPSEVYGLLMKIHSEQPFESNHSRLAAKTYLKMILILLVKYYRSHGALSSFLQEGTADIDRLRPIFDYMDSHYAQRITVDRAAKVLSMSRSHFMRLFQRTTGESFVAYLNRFRVAKAARLLISTNKSIAEVAQAVGFCDQSYFTQVFQKLVKHTPREYRAQAVHSGPKPQTAILPERPLQSEVR